MILSDLQPSERRSAIVLLAALGVALLAALEPFGGTAIPPAEPALHPPPPRMEPEGAPALAASPFDPARGPVAGLGRLPGMAEPVAAPPAPPVLSLTGILVEGDRRRAMFSDAGIWQETGTLVGDWVLEAVEPRRVRLRRGGEVRVIEADDALR